MFRSRFADKGFGPDDPSLMARAAVRTGRAQAVRYVPGRAGSRVTTITLVEQAPPADSMWEDPRFLYVPGVGPS